MKYLYFSSLIGCVALSETCHAMNFSRPTIGLMTYRHYSAPAINIDRALINEAAKTAQYGLNLTNETIRNIEWNMGNELAPRGWDADDSAVISEIAQRSNQAFVFALRNYGEEDFRINSSIKRIQAELSEVIDAIWALGGEIDLENIRSISASFACAHRLLSWLQTRL